MRFGRDRKRCHSREGGNPGQDSRASRGARPKHGFSRPLDSRLRGCLWIPAFAGTSGFPPSRVMAPVVRIFANQFRPRGLCRPAIRRSLPAPAANANPGPRVCRALPLRPARPQANARYPCWILRAMAPNRPASTDRNPARASLTDPRIGRFGRPPMPSAGPLPCNLMCSAVYAATLHHHNPDVESVTGSVSACRGASVEALAVPDRTPCSGRPQGRRNRKVSGRWGVMEC